MSVADPILEGWEPAALVLPDERLDDFILLESGVYLLTFVLAGLLAVGAVRVRRPT